MKFTDLATGLTNPELVTIAVALLGGDKELVDREDVAIKANELAPGRFTWRKFPENIDLDAVGVALRDAKKPKNGGLVTGTNATGWMLAPSGIKWLAQHELSGDALADSTKSRKASVSAALEQECVRMKGTRAYHLFVGGGKEEITINDFRTFTRVNEYFQAKARARRYAVVENAVSSDTHLDLLWSYLKSRFPEEMK